ncbi:MAG: hypothetical protein WBQ14_08815 [Gaiellaceae bacterium]
MTDALGWTRCGFTVLVYVVTDSKSPLIVDFTVNGVTPQRTRSFLLEDEDCVLRGAHTYVYDLDFEQLPSELDSYLAEVLRRTCEAGANVSWMAFESTFSYEYILADEFADQIYGVCLPGRDPLLALKDAELKSIEWKKQLKTIRESVLKND